MLIQNTDGVYDYDVEKDTMNTIETPMISDEYVGMQLKIVGGTNKGKFARIIRNDEGRVCIKETKKAIPRTFSDYILFRTRYEIVEDWIDIK